MHVLKIYLGLDPYGLTPHQYKRVYRRLNNGAVLVPVAQPIVPVVPYRQPIGAGFSKSKSQASAQSKTVSINTPRGLSINVSKSSSQASSSNIGGGRGLTGINSANTQAVANANSRSFAG